MSDPDKKYFGKYRGLVTNNIDPMQIGRIQVIVPDVGLTPTTWAMPCVPLAGKATGMYVIPQIASSVWVEFEHGDADYPIWVGGFWNTLAEVPAMALLAPPPTPPIIINTLAQNTIAISDVPLPPLVAGGILLKSGLSAIMIGPDGVKIIAPKIEINGITIINNGALTVTL
jgi:hypothetical protein